MPVPAYIHRQGKKRMWLRWGWRIARWMTDAEDQSTAGAHLWNHDHPADLTILAWCLYWCWPHCLSPVCTSAHLTLCLSVTWGPLPTDICSLKSTTCKITRQYCYMVLQQSSCMQEESDGQFKKSTVNNSISRYDITGFFQNETACCLGCLLDNICFFKRIKREKGEEGERKRKTYRDDVGERLADRQN